MAKQESVEKVKVKTQTKSTKIGSASINTVNSSHIVQVLVNTMYSNKEGSAVREILSNALDAHKMSKNTTDKIQIQFPNKTFPMFKIRDFGDGLSPEFMKTEYLSLGHSEKRDRNDAVGFMGIGRFALFSLFKCYFLTSYYNGKKYPYSVYLDENGNISLELIENEIESTTEKNGVEVFVMIEKDSQIYSFRDEILKLTFFCKEKVQLLNFDDLELLDWYQKEPILQLNGVKIYEKNDGIGSDALVYCLYDNIPYPITKSFYTKNYSELSKIIANRKIVVLDFEIGSIERTASRENLEKDTNEKTITEIDKRINHCLKEIEKYRQRISDDSKDVKDFLKNANHYFSLFYLWREEIKYQCKETFTNYSISQNGFRPIELSMELKSFRFNTRSLRLFTEDIVLSLNKNFFNFYPDSDVFIFNDKDESDAIMKLKIKKFLLENPKKNAYLITDKGDTKNAFIEKIGYTKLSTMEKIVLTKNNENAGKICFKKIKGVAYGSLMFDSEHKTIEDFDDSIVVYFPFINNKIDIKEDNNHFIIKVFNYVKYRENKKTNVVFCGLAQKNIDKIKTMDNFYDFKSFLNNITTIIPVEDESVFKVGALDFICANLHKYLSLDFIKNLSIDDVKLKEKLKKLNTDLTFYEEHERSYNKYGSTSFEVLELYKNDFLSDVIGLYNEISEDIKNNYPLFNLINFQSLSTDDVLQKNIEEYINLKYNKLIN